MLAGSSFSDATRLPEFVAEAAMLRGGGALTGPARAGTDASAPPPFTDRLAAEGAVSLELLGLETGGEIGKAGATSEAVALGAASAGADAALAGAALEAMALAARRLASTGANSGPALRAGAALERADNASRGELNSNRVHSTAASSTTAKPDNSSMTRLTE